MLIAVGNTMTELARFLKTKVDAASYRKVEDHTGVPDSTVEKIVKGKLSGLPELETLIKIADAYALPLWRVVEMAGAKVGITETPSAQARRLAILAEAQPELLGPIVDRLLKIDPGNLRGVLAYLDLVLRQDEA